VAELGDIATNSIPPVDAAATHPSAFVFMLILALIFGVGRVAKETKISVKKWRSFLHLWMAAYLILLTFLMAVTTAMALVLLFGKNNEPSVTFIPPSFLPMAAAVLGVFGFEFLFRRFIIGFGENQLDLATTLQNFVDQAVSATLEREA
jgi:hypothetical protein